MPDSLYYESWQTPCELVEPALPGEKPVPQGTLYCGAYHVLGLARDSGGSWYQITDRLGTDAFWQVHDIITSVNV